MAAPKTGPTAKKLPEDRLGHRTLAEQQAFEYISHVRPHVYSNHSPAPVGLVPRDEWHDVAKMAWREFCTSPMADLYQGTDYVSAWITCELIHQSLSGPMTAGIMMQLRMYLNDLGFSESSRRAIGVAIRNETEEEDPKKVTALDRMRERKAAGGA